MRIQELIFMLFSIDYGHVFFNGFQILNIFEQNLLPMPLYANIILKI